MSSYPIHLYSLAIKPRYRGLVVLVSKACLEMKKAPAGGDQPSSMAILRSPPRGRVAASLRDPRSRLIN